MLAAARKATATPPFMSQEPSPNKTSSFKIEPSLGSGSPAATNLAFALSATGTVSICPATITRDALFKLVLAITEF